MSCWRRNDYERETGWKMRGAGMRMAGCVRKEKREKRERFVKEKNHAVLVDWMGSHSKSISLS